MTLFKKLNSFYAKLVIIRLSSIYIRDGLNVKIPMSIVMKII